MLSELVLLLWKNCIIRKRHWFTTIFEILLPTLLFMFLAYFHSRVGKIKGTAEMFHPSEIFHPVDQQSIKEEFTTELGNYPLLYAPSTSTFASTAMKKLTNKTNIAIKGFENEKALLSYYSSMNRSMHENVYAVIFEDLPSNVPVPPNLKYKICIASNEKLETSLLFKEDVMFGVNVTDIYYSTGFSGLQLYIDEIYMEMCEVKVPYIQVQKFPYPAYRSQEFIFVFTVLISIFVVCSYGLLCPAILRRIVEEKNSGIKELMKMMGLKTWMLWLGWFINAMIVNVLSVAIIVVCLTIPFGNSPALLSHSNPLLVAVFLLLYCSAGITFCFAVSSAFSEPNNAEGAGIILWYLSYILTFWMTMKGQVSVEIQFFTALLPNFAVNLGFYTFLSYEGLGQGVSWNNLFEGDTAVGYVCIMLIVDSIIYTLVALYVEAVLPGNYGVAKPVYFIFMPSFWRSRRVEDTELEDLDIGRDMVFEPPPKSLRAGIQIRNLHKVYYDSFRRNPKVVVDGVNLDIYDGEITVLLGHNGAGKTTLMLLLTGMMSASSGSIYINDYDITTNLSKVRESLGLCTQDSLLFVDLTVSEHLIFFAMLKGYSWRDARMEAKELLEELNLSEKENNFVSDLSGGMKRKLSLGIALIGNSEVLILDEPTAGMDVETRRSVWDLLLSMRGERTILITTHFMEEADVLGDRIAIMDHGLVRCYGTPLFLKKQYGTGYQLTLLKEDNCDANEVTRVLQAAIPDVVLKSDSGSILKYSVPIETAEKLPELFDALESRKSALKISSIGMSITSLDEVFLNVGKESENEEGSSSEGQTSLEYTEGLEASDFDKLRGWSLYCQQMRSLLIKEILLTKRNCWSWLLFVAILLILTILAVLNIEGKQERAKPLELKLEKYGKTIVMYSDDSKQYARQYVIKAGSELIKTDKKYVQQYVQIMKKAGSELKKTDNLTDSLLSVGENDLVSYNNKYIVAADFSGNITALYSTIAYHSLPISLNLIMNSFLSLNNTISVTNHPMSTSEETTEIMKGVSQKETKIFSSCIITVGLLIFTALFIVIPHVERVNKTKRLQYMCGVSPAIYWLSCFFWDFLLYLLVVVIVVLITIIFDTMDYFSGTKEIGTLMLLFILYGLSTLPFVYVFSFMSKAYYNAFQWFTTVNFIFGAMPVVMYFVKAIFELEQTLRELEYTFNLFPHFAVSDALIHFVTQALENNQCKSVSCKPNDLGFCCRDFDPSSNVKPYLEFANKDNPNGLMLEVLYLAFDGVLFLLILALLDHNIFAIGYETVLRIVFGTDVKTKKELDEDVVQEQDHVDEEFEETDILNSQSDIMLVQDLVKKYKGRFAAVKGISFGVLRGECFGLLGVNGAGRSTIFKMLTGDEIPTRGDAAILSYTLRKNKKKYMKQIGYCPQFDATNNDLTGREMLWLYASLRGIPRENVDEKVTMWVALVGLQEYENQKCGTYSGGNKRKLNTAIALIGNSPLLLLDEPTAGIDPVAKHKLWTLFSMLQEYGQSLVLTSHSMDECEALCSRLAIMVAGQFVCIGPIQYLKQKFGQGFTIKIKLKVVDDYDEQAENVTSDFEEHPLFVDNCELKDEHQGLLHYHVTNTSILWSKLFLTMQELKNTHGAIEDYTITEPTLEEVFLYFTKEEMTE